MNTYDEDEYNHAVDVLDENFQRVDVSPTNDQLLGGFTVVCLILNRTIGSGIFVTPGKVLNGTGSIGATISLWAIGGLITTCGLLVWLEFGLSVPLRNVPGSTEMKSVPRSGGEKNYLEFVFPRPRFLTTCMYGIVFLFLGNLSGNGYAIGLFIMQAAGNNDPSKGSVIFIAVLVLTLCVSLHIFSRRAGILLNNTFAVLKVILLLAIIILGFIKASGHNLGGDPNAIDNLEPSASFSRTGGSDVVSIVDSFFYIFFAYSGFDQPFYILSEVRKPRKTFPKYTLIAMLIVTALFVLVNISFFCVVPKDMQIGQPADIASVFLARVFGNETASRAMAGLIAISIFGNILVMTYTAPRVKQEIAKEAILPFSLFFSTCHTTPLSWIKAIWQQRTRRTRRTAAEEAYTHLEQSPMAALLLHWFTSIFLIAVTSMISPQTGYSILVELYSYVLVAGIGFAVSGSLLYLKFFRRGYWQSNRNFKPWLDPLPAAAYFLASGFLLFGSFAKPSASSPLRFVVQDVPWYLIPTIGQSAWFWGIAWFLGLKFVMWNANRQLVVTRVPFIVPDDEDPGQWIQKSEIIDHEWPTVSRISKATRKKQVHTEISVAKGSEQSNELRTWSIDGRRSEGADRSSGGGGRTGGESRMTSIIDEGEVWNMNDGRGWGVRSGGGGRVGGGLSSERDLEAEGRRFY